MAFDQNKPVRTRDGRAARIICTDAKGDQPIVALITNGGEENEERYSIDGKWYIDDCDNNRDLVNIPQKRSGWVNVYEGTLLHSSKEMADEIGGSKRIACIHIEFEEGEGL